MTQKKSRKESDFSKTTIKKLAKRAAYHCSNCQISTLSAIESNNDDHAHTGQAAHIIAAAPKGPRAKSDMTATEKSDITNGIYLCEICAKLIDAKRGTDYLPEKLRQMKKNHEHLTRQSIIPMSPERFAGFMTKRVEKASTSSSPVEQSDLSIQFVYPKFPALVLVNQSPVVAKDIKWTIALWNMDLPDRDDPLPIPVTTFDFLGPNAKGGPQNLFSAPHVQPLLKSGNRLFGSTSVLSPDCIQGRTYIVYIVLGKGGWFAEVNGKGSGDILIPPDFSKNTRDLYFKALEDMIPTSARIPIDQPERKGV